MLLRWDGESWGVAASPNPGSLSNALLDVAADGDSAWAVGYESGEEGYRALVLRNDGSGWRAVRTPAFGDGDNVLTSISVSSGQVWAAGYYVDGTDYRPLALRSNGGSWERVPDQDDGTAIFRDIDASSATDAWAVGFEYEAERGDYAATTWHWDGSGWTAVPSSLDRPDASSGMLDVAGTPNDSQVWAAGQTSEKTDRPANVEVICPSGDLAGDASSRDHADSQARAGDPQRSPERTDSARPSAPDASSTPVAGLTPVRAVDKAAEAGIQETTRTYGAVVEDFDGDRLPDIFLGRHGSPPRLYHNDGDGTFTKADNSGKSFGRGRIDRHGCDAADVNQDGLEDIFCAVGALHGVGAKQNGLFIQRPDRTFVDRAAGYGVLEPFSRGRSSTFLDANGDAYPDLVMENQSDRPDGMPSPTRLFVNQEGRAFRPAPEYGLEFESEGGQAIPGDLNGDGWQDLLVDTNGSSQRVSDLRAHRNERGQGFTEVGGESGLGHGVVDATLADVNGDGRPDVVEVTAEKLRVLLNDKGKFSAAYSTGLSYGRAIATGDVNGDDRADIYVMRGKGGASSNAPDRVFLNDGGGSFAQTSSIPSTSKGEAESVFPIDYDGNGLTDFLVLNGLAARNNLGPVQLIAFYRDAS